MGRYVAGVAAVAMLAAGVTILAVPALPAWLVPVPLVLAAALLWRRLR